MKWGGEVNDNPLQYSCLENPMDRGAWWAAVHGVAESWTRLSDFTFTFHFHALKKEMATHSSVLAWRIPGTVEPTRRWASVRHDWHHLAAAWSEGSLVGTVSLDCISCLNSCEFTYHNVCPFKVHFRMGTKSCMNHCYLIPEYVNHL